MEIDYLKLLQKWFKNQCNGDWEHQQGIEIKTLDNPGWAVTIDLEETGFENKPFNTIKYENSVDDWMTCRIVEKKFEGFCGPYNLNKILEVFLSWIEEK